MKRIRNCILLGVITVMSSGCMTFNKNTLPVTDELKPPSTKVIMQTKVENFAKLTNGIESNYEQGKKIGNILLKDIMTRWKEKEVISTSGDFTQADKPSSIESDYSLILTGTSDEQFSKAAAFVTGYTMFLIPSFSTIEQTVKVDLINNKTSKKYSVEAKDSYSVALHILFLPLFIAQNTGASNMHSHMADYIYTELYKQGAFN